MITPSYIYPIKNQEWLAPSWSVGGRRVHMNKKNAIKFIEHEEDTEWLRAFRELVDLRIEFLDKFEILEEIENEK